MIDTLLLATHARSSKMVPLPGCIALTSMLQAILLPATAMTSLPKLFVRQAAYAAAACAAAAQPVRLSTCWTGLAAVSCLHSIPVLLLLLRLSASSSGSSARLSLAFIVVSLRLWPAGTCLPHFLVVRQPFSAPTAGHTLLSYL